MSQKKKVSLRKAFHTLGNRHHLVILIPGFIRQKLNEVLKDKNLSRESREVIEKAIRDLRNLEGSGSQADSLLTAAKKAVYENLNPDEILVEIEEKEPK